MVRATEFFSRPAYGMCQIFSQVVNIFVDHFRTFAALAFLQALAFIPAIGFFVVVAIVVLASEMAVVYEFMDNGVRRLSEGTSAWFDETDDNTAAGSSYQPPSYGYNDPYSTASTTDQDVPGVVGFVLAILGLYVLFVATLICISAAFQGAFVRAASEVFAGRSPNWQACLQIGWKKMCSIICFGLLCLASVVVIGAVWFAVILLAAGDNPSFGLVFLSILVFVVVYAVFRCCMTAGITTIMVEDKSAIAAFSRSWNLCKSSICFIFCCGFCFYLLEIGGQITVKRFLLDVFSVGQENTGASLLIVGFANWIMGLLLGPLNATLNPVIYFSLRIRHEGLTMQQLQSELSLAEDSIELRTGEGGTYNKVGTQGNKGDLTPIAHAEVV